MDATIAATAFGMLATLPAVNKISFKTLLIVSKAYVVIRFLGDFVFSFSKAGKL